MWRCTACGFAQPQRIPALPRYFERMYRPALVARVGRAGVRLDLQGFDLPPDSRDARRARAVHARTLLDVGCHAGRFLQLAGEAGWRAEGTEINERTATHAAARTGVPVHRLSAERLPELGRQVQRRHADRRARAHSRTGSLAVDRSPRRRGRRVGGDQGAVRARAAAEGDLARPPAVGAIAPRSPTTSSTSTTFRRAPSGTRSTRAGFDDITVEIAAPECPPGARGVIARSPRAVQRGRRMPGGIHTPIALHLQAFARAGRASGSTRRHDASSRAEPVGRHPDLQQRGRPAPLPDQLAAERGRLRRRDHRDRRRVPRRHARVPRIRESVGVGPAAPPLGAHGRCPRAAVHERGACRPRGRR